MDKSNISTNPHKDLSVSGGLTFTNPANERVIHELKTWPCYFEAVLRGDKNFEIRYNKDRGFQKGDTVILQEYDPDKPEVLQEHTREIEAEISYVTDFEQKEGYVVFGLRNVREI